MEKIDIATLNRVTALENIRIINSTAVGITLWQNVLANQKVWFTTIFQMFKGAHMKQIISNISRN